MLQKLNERLQGIIAWVIIGIVAFTFTLFGIEYYIQSRETSTQVVLEVNGLPITKEMVNLKVERAHRAIENQSDLNEKLIRQQAIDTLVDTQIAVQAASQSGFYIGHTEVEHAIFSLPEFSEEGRFSPSRYQQVLASALYTNETFQHEIHQQMLIQQQRFAFLATDFTLPNELLTYVQKFYQARRYRYVEIPAAAFLKPQEVTNEEAATYYHKHTHDFTSPERVSLEYVRLSMAEIKNKLTLTSDELHQYYLENRTSLTKDGKLQTFDEVKKNIEAQLLQEKGQLEYARLLEALSDLSYQSSDELETTAHALGLHVEKTEFFTKNDGHSLITQHPQVVRLAFSDALLVSRENSNPLQLDPETVIVFRVHEHESAKPLAFDAVKSTIETLVAQEKSVRAVTQLGEKLRQAHEADRQKLMSKYKLSWREVPLSSHAELIPDAIRALAFEVNTPNQQIGRLLSLKDNKAYILLKLEEIVLGKLTDIPKDSEKRLIQHLDLEQGQAAYDAYFTAQRKNVSLTTL